MPELSWKTRRIPNFGWSSEAESLLVDSGMRPGLTHAKHEYVEIEMRQSNREAHCYSTLPARDRSEARRGL